MKLGTMTPDASREAQNRLQLEMTQVMRDIEALPNARELFAAAPPDAQAQVEAPSDVQ